MYNNNYGFNPYGNYMPQRNMQPIQPIEPTPVFNGTRPVLSGKQVDSIEVVKAIDIPLDGSVSYFPLTNGSAIVTKQLQQDGTSKITIYEPKIEKEISKFAATEDMDAVKDDLKNLKKELDDIKTKLKGDE